MFSLLTAHFNDDFRIISETHICRHEKIMLSNIKLCFVIFLHVILNHYLNTTCIKDTAKILTKHIESQAQKRTGKTKFKFR